MPRSIVVLPLLWLLIRPLPLVAQGVMPPAEAPAAPPADTEFLERFVGEWEGVGKAEDRETRDRMQFEWILGRRFLRFSYTTVSGDNYQSVGNTCYDASRKIYRWWEFNNGIWPIREYTGRREVATLILDERTETRTMRLIFAFLDPDTIRMEEKIVKDEVATPYVTMTFHRLKK